MAPPKVKIRKWNLEDIPNIVKCHQQVYLPEYPMDDLFDKRTFTLEFQKFPEGQVLAEIDGEIAGYACSIIVQLDDQQEFYTFSEMTGSGTFSTHTPGGDTLYGADIAVAPKFRGQGVASYLYKFRLRLMKDYNLRRMVAHGRIPGYNAHAGKLTPEQYVAAVIAGELKDSALRAHLKVGYKVKKVLMDHLDDYSSLNYATWLEMDNPGFNAEKRAIAASPIQRPVRRVRVCAAQFEMRKIKGWKEFAQNVDFFVDTAHSYHSHFLMFPEFFTIQLFSSFDPDLGDIDAIKKLSEFTDQYRELLKSKAKEHGLYIIGGSHPVERDGKIYNTSHLFTPSGRIETQDKLHISPSERKIFNIQAGEKIKVFDTPMARIAIAISYDIEFPEMIRLMVLHGAEMIFVPFSCDERKAYNRLRFCAHARAVENYVYVAMAGIVGNMPNLKSYSINYAQSAIITPSDFSFPNNSIEAEADPNTETVIIADLDINTLLMQRENGSVRPLYDRRLDLYDLNSVVPVEVINVR